MGVRGAWPALRGGALTPARRRRWAEARHCKEAAASPSAVMGRAGPPDRSARRHGSSTDTGRKRCALRSGRGPVNADSSSKRAPLARGDGVVGSCRDHDVGNVLSNRRAQNGWAGALGEKGARGTLPRRGARPGSGTPRDVIAGAHDSARGGQENPISGCSPSAARRRGWRSLDIPQRSDAAAFLHQIDRPAVARNRAPGPGSRPPRP